MGGHSGVQKIKHKKSPRGDCEEVGDEDGQGDAGEVFKGEMVTPWKDLSEAYTAQTAYLERQNAQYEAALSEIEVALGG